MHERERIGREGIGRQGSQGDPLAALRRRVEEIQHAGAPAAGVERGHMALGAPLDGALGGGLPLGALHEVFACDKGNGAAALGFALALAAGTRRPVVWVRQDLAALEGGDLYGPGCAAFGLDPARLIVVQGADATDTLAAAEEALRHAVLGLVVVEPWGMPARLDLTATRRLALRAERSGVPALLLRSAAEPVPSAAATRWLASAAPSGAAGAPAFCLGPPAFALELARNRAGPTGRWIVEWNAHARRFAPAPRRPAAAPPVHRPAASQGPARADGPAPVVVGPFERRAG
ncbi:ImuA family protein [Xanthobacter versatilis]|uniref:ImuA family protein n=1 Tax=Xanthobacter autotrophicus (strain ATCC BAA-1158 / Py2) TaxID=78245 RepID=UPI00372B9083